MQFKIDKTAIFLITIFGIVAVPGSMLLAVWRLTHGLHWADAHIGELTAALISFVAALAIIRRSALELAGAIGVSITDAGIIKTNIASQVNLAWEQIESIESAGIGVLNLCSGSKFIRLSTYLFEGREKLIKTLEKKTGRTITEKK